MCVTIIGTPRNSYEQNVTEAFYPLVFLLFNIDQSV